jgi:hypothetical protein
MTQKSPSKKEVKQAKAQPLKLTIAGVGQERKVAPSGISKTTGTGHGGV